MALSSVNLIEKMREMRVPRKARAAAWATVLLLAAAGVAGQHAEDRPLPSSPCPDVFSYEGPTVDWDRWYGVVIVTTDIPLTGLRLDVWLSRPALALRHDWDGNVTTLDNKRFTILNLYKRVDPGPATAVRIVVKFDENEEVPVLRAIEQNGRRICSSRAESQSYDAGRRPSSRPRPDYGHDDELPLSHSPPSNSKYNFDRTTQRAPPPAPYDNSYYDSSRDRDKNTLKRKPASASVNPAYDETPRRQVYVQQNAPAPDDAYQRAPPGGQQGSRQPAYYDEERSERPAPASRRPASGQAYASASAAPGKPSGGGASKLAADGGRSGAAPASQGRYKTTRAPEDGYRKATTQPPARAPAYDSPRRPAGEDEIKYVEEEDQGSRPRRPAALPPIDVRIDAQPLSGDRDSLEAEARRAPEDEGAWLPPGQRKRVGAGAGPPGLSGNPPPGHGGPVPGHNKGNANNNHNSNNYNNNNNNNNYNQNNNGGRLTTSEPDRWPPSTFSSVPKPERPRPDADDNKCGRTLTVAPLITHGHNTSRGQWPWHAALYQIKGVDLKYICGGTLVSANFVVTAAHCVTRPTTGRAVDPDTIIAYLGKYHLHRWTNEEGVQQGKVAAIHVHPNFNTSSFRADVALLELATHLSYTQYVRHVCLWGRDEPAGLSYVVNQEGYVVGWGYDENGDLTEELRLAAMPIVAEQTCLRSYPEFYSRFSNERTFCAGYKNGTSACNGDSGGGLFLPRVRHGTKVWYIRGLVSVSVSRDDQRVCNTNHYVVFTDLAKYRDWITSLI